MYITGPEVVKAVTGEEVSHEDLGGASAHASGGVAHFTAENEEECSKRKKVNWYPSANNVDMKVLIVL